VLFQNLSRDALTMLTYGGQPITFAEWATWARASSSGATSALTFSPVRLPSAAEGSLFAHRGKHEIFTPSEDVPRR